MISRIVEIAASLKWKHGSFVRIYDNLSKKELIQAGP